MIARIAIAETVVAILNGGITNITVLVEAMEAETDFISSVLSQPYFISFNTRQPHQSIFGELLKQYFGQLL